MPDTKIPAFLFLVFLLLAGRPANAQVPPPPTAAALKQADRLFKDEHWAEAQTAYDRARDQEKYWHAANMRRAVEGATACLVHLGKWNDALDRLEDYTARNRDSFEEIAGRRLLAALYLNVPHNGTMQNGKLVRGEGDRYPDERRERQDARQAIGHLERARDVAVRLAAALPPDATAPAERLRITQEWIGTDFDLASMLTRASQTRTRSDNLNWWLGGGAQEKEDEADNKADDADQQAPSSATFYYGEDYARGDQPPTGLLPRPDGGPLFPVTPARYDAATPPANRFRFLLAEVERLDSSEHRDDAARALFRRAVSAQELYGPQTAERWLNWWKNHPTFNDARSLLPPVPATKIWQLQDHQALTPVGGRLAVLDLPDEESPLALLQAVETRCPQSTLVPEARYARACYHQSRQQFPQALAEHRAFLTQYPTHPRAADARQQIKTIESPDVELASTGAHLPGERPRLAFTARNTGTVEFTARRFDVMRYSEAISAASKDKDLPFFARFSGYDFLRDKNWMNVSKKDPAARLRQKYLAKESVNWFEALPPGQENRVVEGATLAPLTDPGAYVVEARAAGSKDVSRLFVLVTDLLLVRKTVLDDNGNAALFIACDARTGRPLPDRVLQVYEHWTDEQKTGGGKPATHLERRTLVTDTNGAAIYRCKHRNDSSNNLSGIDAALVGTDGRIAFANYGRQFDGATTDGAESEEKMGFLVTDRPVYRPGATMHFCLWLRLGKAGVYRPPPPGPVKVVISSPQGSPAQTLTLQSDGMGMASGEWVIGAAASLGQYSIDVQEPTPDSRLHSWTIPTAGFQVEEYRQPEFAVNVRPATTQARLGEKFKATVEARYYFGASVTGAKVSYKVYRNVFATTYFEPGEYDGFYGKGYGLVFYPYPWLSWWRDWGNFIGWGGERPSDPVGSSVDQLRTSARELVAQGEVRVDAAGHCEIEVDTARARAEQGGHDHVYTIEVSVRGASRRVVEGQGSVVAARREFNAYVATDRAWYEARHEARVQVRALAAGGVPITTKGQLVVSRVRYEGPNHDEAKEEEEKRWDAETGADGRLAFTYPFPGEGQYHVAFVARDSRGEEVRGNAVFWVSGPKFDGRVYRFNELEVISDKRSYRVGETAHLLVNTAGDNARVLFADRVSDHALLRYRFLDVPQRSVVVDVPIGADCTPNFFVEATVVRNGRVRTEVCELIVPPERGLLRVAVRTDKPVYGPGEKGTVHVEATDLAGHPASGRVTLTAFDKAVTYISPEGTYTPGEFFHGGRKYYEARSDSSFEGEYSASGGFSGAEGVSFGLKDGSGNRDNDWEIGAGTQATPLWRMMRERQWSNSSASRIVVTGSNIPSREEYSAPKETADAPVAGVAKAPPAQPDPRAPAAPRGVGTEGKPAGAQIRTRFADTALWLPALALDEKGTADAEITFPESLTTWRVHGYALTADTQVGDAAAEAVTTKKLLVRLLSPRFFTERDEAVLSAAVNNDLPDARDVTAELLVPAAQFQPTSESTATPDADGNLRLTARASVAAGGEHRFDWPVRVLRPGLATITARALAGQESDGVRLTFPVETHGISQTLVQSGSLRAGQGSEVTLRLDVPSEIDPAQTQLEIGLSPSLAGVMIDALPYLADYPYGCVEQTMSRFYPSVVVRDCLKRLGTNLETLGNQRRQMNPADLASRFGDSPVYDSPRLERMIREGLTAIYDFQISGGGWGWWHDEEPSLFQTCYVLQGLQAAKAAGVALDEGKYRGGFEYLRKAVGAELAKPERKQRLGGEQDQAYLAYVLSLEPEPDDQKGTQRRWLDRLYVRRGSLNNYGRALCALALHHAGRDEQARTVLRNLLQFAERDDSNETAWVRTPPEGWWHWYNNDIETNAWALKALVALDPKNDLAPRLVKWLLNNRRGGSYWRSTRDTAQVISAMTDYLLASGEAAPDYTLTVRVDGEEARNVHVTRENLFAFDNKVTLHGLRLKPGPHEVTLHKQGAGALYYSTRLTYFTKEEGVRPAGGDLAVERTYSRLVPRVKPASGSADAPDPATPGGGTKLPTGYTRVALKDGDELLSGDEIEVALRITAKNTFDYLAFEDRKPAGCEPVEVRSGGRWAGGLCANVELRDTKTVFFIGLLEQGEHWLRYRLRAETPGKFHALPATGAAMYAPEVCANSAEMHLNIRDRTE